MPRKKAAVSSFSIDDVKYTTREIPKNPRYSPFREIATKLIESGEGACAEKLSDKNAALRVAGYLRDAGCATRMSEVEGAGWCVWNRGAK